MSVSFQDAIDTVRELTETICRMLQDPDAGDGITDMGVMAVETGNQFLRDAGHEPVDEANLPGRDEDDEEDDEGGGEGGIHADKDGNVLLFVSISPDSLERTMGFDALENAARELLSRRGYAHGELALEPPDQEDNGTGMTANFALPFRVWQELERKGMWELEGEGVRIDAEMP